MEHRWRDRERESRGERERGERQSESARERGEREGRRDRERGREGERERERESLCERTLGAGIPMGNTKKEKQAGNPCEKRRDTAKLEKERPN